MKLGRLRPTEEHKRRALPLSRYMRTPLPVPPITLDNTPGVRYGLYHNDVYGDCTIAALANFLSTSGVRRGFEASFTDKDATDFYFDMSGGKDDGLYEVDVLERAVNKGFPLNGLHKLAAFVAIDPTDIYSIRSSAFLFDAIYVGVELPRAAEATVGGLWDSADTLGDNAPGSWGPHAVIVPKYDALGPTFITWGQQQQATWSWWRNCVTEAYALLWRDVAVQHGVDWDALQADLQALKVA